MADLSELARELREALQQQTAVTARIEAACAALERESAGLVTTSIVPYADLVTEWNARCASRGMKRRNLAGELKPAMLRVWRRFPNVETWKAAFDACARDAWWRGEGGWQGNLESFLRPKSFGKFFDEAIGAAPVTDLARDTGLGLDDAADRIQDKVEDEIGRLMSDRARPLPSGIQVKDPREVRGKDDREFAKRYEALKEALASDWRFA